MGVQKKSTSAKITSALKSCKAVAIRLGRFDRCWMPWQGTAVLSQRRIWCRNSRRVGACNKDTFKLLSSVALPISALQAACPAACQSKKNWRRGALLVTRRLLFRSWGMSYDRMGMLVGCNRCASASAATNCHKTRGSGWTAIYLSCSQPLNSQARPHPAVALSSTCGTGVLHAG